MDENIVCERDDDIKIFNLMNENWKYIFTSEGCKGLLTLFNFKRWYLRNYEFRYNEIKRILLGKLFYYLF